MLTGASPARPAFEPPPTDERTIQRPAAQQPRTAAGHGRGRWAALGVLALAIAAVGGIALASGGGGQGSEPEAADAGEAKAEKPEEVKDPKPAEPKPAAAPALAPAPEPAAPDGAALNDQGFVLVNQGRYEEAIPLLEQAASALEGGGDELTYGYALFNLGHALRLAGRPDEAIPVLEQRMGVSDQQDVVQRELDAAYAEAGGDFSGEENGDGRGPDGFGPPGHHDD